MTSENDTAQRYTAALQRIASEDAVGQLRRRERIMAKLGSENGELKLDWVEGVARLLADGTKLEEVEAEAQALWQQGIRHLIWAGMGGSVITVRVLAELGFCDSHHGEHIAVYPLDSTDPAPLNTIVRKIAVAKGLALPTQESAITPEWLHTLLADTMMVGVSMGMTSEEPITHLTWFTALLEQAGLTPAEHLLVMTLPGSYLDRFAHEQHAPSRPLQLDSGTGTGGRMSAPATRVFLLPAALYLTRLTGTTGQLRAVLENAWRDYNLDLANSHPTEHQYVQLAAALDAASQDGACRLLLTLPGRWQALVTWIEQLMEESLGKGGKGIVVFHEQALSTQAPCFCPEGTLHVAVTTTNKDTAGTAQQAIFSLYQPHLAATDSRAQLAAAATGFLGWQLTMALYGYLHDITFAGQPAVENYKARARALRSMTDPLEVLRNWDATFTDGSLTLFAPQGVQREGSSAAVFAQTLKQAASETTRCLGYLDFTINGEVPDSVRQSSAQSLTGLANTQLGVPFKLRTAPADYHSTEQGEMDGPPYLVSLRLLLREHEQIIAGTYDDAFLRAQAVSTWQAMLGQGRSCFFLLIDEKPEDAALSLQRFFTEVAQLLMA